MSSIPIGGTGVANLLAARPNAPNVPRPDSTPQTRRLYKECQQFEGVLIANLWSELDQGVSMTDLGSDPGAMTMQGLGIESAANGIAMAGGLGLARILYDALAPRLAAPHGAG
jgi:hypothetical protein